MAEENKTIETADVASAKKPKKAEKAKKSDKKPLGKRLADWFRSYKSEAKKIVWAQPADVVKNTLVVLVYMIAIAAVIAILDFLFQHSLSALVGIISR